MILFLTGNVMAQSVRERIPEFATMKALGFTDSGILTLVIVEAGTLCVAGAALGLALASLVPMGVRALLPNVPVPVITSGVVAIALGSAVLVAAASALPASLRARRLSIAEALGGR
jgi:putative ABC transport system permease protein